MGRGLRDVDDYLRLIIKAIFRSKLGLAAMHQIPRSNQVSHKRSFVPSAACIWNSLPQYIPSLEKRACFKKEVIAILATASQHYT